jgi:hypothetical protein
MSRGIVSARLADGCARNCTGYLYSQILDKRTFKQKLLVQQACTSIAAQAEIEFAQTLVE